MARPKPLIPTSLLSSAGFRDDLRRLLDLSVPQLEQLNSLATGPDGLSPAQLAARFAEEAAITIEAARGALRVAEYLYERCRELRMPPDQAVGQLAESAARSAMGDISDKASALRSLLASKDEYEAGRHVALESLSVVPHLAKLEGIWDIRPVFHREREEVVARIPVLLLNVCWHDTTGQTHETALQLDEDDWEDVREGIDKLEAQRRIIRAYVDEPSA